MQGANYRLPSLCGFSADSFRLNAHRDMENILYLNWLGSKVVGTLAGWMRKTYRIVLCTDNHVVQKKLKKPRLTIRISGMLHWKPVLWWSNLSLTNSSSNYTFPESGLSRPMLQDKQILKVLYMHRRVCSCSPPFDLRDQCGMNLQST